MQLLLYVGFVVGGTAVCWIGSGMLEQASRRLAAHYQVPPVVQGAVILAIGSSFPELSSTVLATLIHDTFDLGVAAIVGSALFNVLVIPGVAGLVGGRIKAGRLLIFKDVQFYMLSIAVVLLTFALAVIYHPVPETQDLDGTVTRSLALLPVLVYGVYLYLQVVATRDYEGGGAPDGISPGREWGRLVASLVFILIGTEGLVRAAVGFGDWFGTPSFLWGFTVVAAGTSVPDMFVSVRAAHRGRGTVSLANVLGSNVFDLLIAVPAGILVAGASTVDFGAALPMMAILAVAAGVLLVVLRTGEALELGEAKSLLVLYGGFILLVVLETAGLFHLMT